MLRPPLLHQLLPPLRLLLAGLWVLASEPGFQDLVPQVTFPKKIEGNTSSDEQVSYIIQVDEKPYTVHLKKRYFLADHFRVYLYDQGSLTSRASDIPAQCYYQGYVEDHPDSVVTLSTCSGLRGILQFENVSYGIEPVESTIIFQHILYKLGFINYVLDNLNKNSRSIADSPMDYGIMTNEKSESPSLVSYPLFLEVSLVVDKDLYDYLGSDSTIVTNKVIEIINLVNSMFTQLDVTIVLSSLELWSDNNKISLTGDPTSLLHRFLNWKKTYLTLRPHDIAFLFMYAEYPEFVGAAFSGKMCVDLYSAGIAVYLKGMTLETFSVVATQILSLSLGISLDNPEKCHCSESGCIMNATNPQSGGRKTFSNCSLNDFQNLIKNMFVKCLQNRPQFQTSNPVCGNRVVEGNEACDCGNEDQCGPESCCEPQTCVLKQGMECDSSVPTAVCCQNCRFSAQGRECRPIKHQECDIPETCNGSSAHCPPDITIQDGNRCKNNTLFCFGGNCQDLDARCEELFGKGSKNAPFACYEEIQSHNDRFGNCGKDTRNRYLFCGLRNLICGRIVCTYPQKIPYISPINLSSVLYIFARDHVCVTVDAGPSASEDPFKTNTGSVCDIERICLNGVCLETRYIINLTFFCSQKCSGHGVCNSLGECHCEQGYQPPNCEPQSRSSILTDQNGLMMKRASSNPEKKWLLGLYIALTVLITAALIGVAWNALQTWLTKEEESLSSKATTEDSSEPHTSSN